MAKQGASLEQLVRAIQLTINDSSNTIVKTNIKVNDTNGIKREIDVLVENNEMNPPHLIAFECKDYNKKVDIQIVDAVIGKFYDLPSIQKKIIVANKGYSKSAKIKAKKHGIELYTLTKVPLAELLLHSTPILSRKMKTILLDVSFLLADSLSSETPELINISDTTEKNERYEAIFINNPPCYDDIKLMELGERFAKNDLKPIEDYLCLEVPYQFPIIDLSGRRYFAKAIIYHVEISICPQKGELIEQRRTPKGTDKIIAAEYRIDDAFSMVTVKTTGKDITYLKSEEKELLSPKTSREHETGLDN